MRPDVHKNTQSLQRSLKNLKRRKLPKNHKLRVKIEKKIFKSKLPIKIILSVLQHILAKVAIYLHVFI